MLTEFGGIAFTPGPAETWGYSRSSSADELADQYSRLLAAVHALPLLAGFCYTQFSDTYQEANGLLYADRTPKFALEEMALATRGPRRPTDEPVEREWLDRLRRFRRDGQAAPRGAPQVPVPETRP